MITTIMCSRGDHMLNNRKEATAAGDKYFFTGKTCKHGHTEKRFTHNGCCYRCVQNASKANWKRKRYSDIEYRKRRIFDLIKNRAERTGIEFSVKFESIEWPTHCPVLGMKLNYLEPTGKQNSDSPSFDKIDPNKGYIKGNVKVISLRANRIKFDASLDELKKVYLYMKENL